MRPRAASSSSQSAVVQASRNSSAIVSLLYISPRSSVAFATRPTASTNAAVRRSHLC